MAKEVINDVPEEKVEELKRQFESVGCDVEVKEQDNGLYTVIATCPGNS